LKTNHLATLRSVVDLDRRLKCDSFAIIGILLLPGQQGCQMVYVFSYQKSQFLFSLEGLGVENFGILYRHLVYFGLFPPFWYVLQRKIWQPCRSSGETLKEQTSSDLTTNDFC
jgi:hypothetical protein